MTTPHSSSIKVETLEQFELLFVGDRSESMTSMGDSPWKGVCDWANEQAIEAQKNNYDTRINIVVFDSESECVLDSVSSNEWTTITENQAKEWMKPTGCTRLHDTVIEELEILLHKKNKRGGECKAIFALFTDGKDNVSDSSLSQMNKAVKEARLQGVVCYFLAANQDAIASGQRYGFDSRRCLTTGADPQTSSQAYKTISGACLRTTTTPHLDTGFTKLERHYSAPQQPY